MNARAREVTHGCVLISTGGWSARTQYFLNRGGRGWRASGPWPRALPVWGVPHVVIFRTRLHCFSCTSDSGIFTTVDQLDISLPGPSRPIVPNGRLVSPHSSLILNFASRCNIVRLAPPIQVELPELAQIGTWMLSEQAQQFIDATRNKAAGLSKQRHGVRWPAHAPPSRGVSARPCRV